MIAREAIAPVKPLSIVRYSYYAFIFSIPIESLDMGIEGGVFSLSKLTGIFFLIYRTVAAAIILQEASETILVLPCIHSGLCVSGHFPAAPISGACYHAAIHCYSDVDAVLGLI